MALSCRIETGSYMEKQEMTGQKRIYNIFYYAMVGTTVLMLLWMGMHFQGDTPVETGLQDTVSWQDGWTDEAGQAVDLDHLHEMEGVRAGHPFCIYHDIPEELPEGQSVCFQTRNFYYRVLINDRVVYDPYVQQSRFYTKSFGTRWNTIDLSTEDAGGSFAIEITPAYEKAKAAVHEVYLGSGRGVLLLMLKDRIVAFITCVIFIFVGVLLILADIPINMLSQKNHELRYLGLFAIMAAVWCLSETRLLQIFTDNARIMHFLSCSCLMLMPLPMIFYLDEAFGFRYRWIMPVFSSVTLVEYVATMALQILGIADMQELLPVTHLLLVVTAGTMLFMTLRHIFSRSGGDTKLYSLQAVGITIMALTAMIDLGRFYLTSSSDIALFVRIGLMVCILCYGFASLEKTVNAVKLGARAELVSQLAYKDGLTGVGNRTALKERIAELEKRDGHDDVAIIMFDVNDLKMVNDNLGHQMGDRMLIAAARVLEEAFSPAGNCYRIGGDEFTVIITGSQAEERSAKGIAEFEKSLQRFNEKEEREFTLSIAHGCAVHQRTANAEETIQRTYQRADELMYERKRQMKATRKKKETTYEL